MNKKNKKSSSPRIENTNRSEFQRVPLDQPVLLYALIVAGLLAAWAWTRPTLVCDHDCGNLKIEDVHIVRDIDHA